MRNVLADLCVESEATHRAGDAPRARLRRSPRRRGRRRGRERRAAVQAPGDRRRQVLDLQARAEPRVRGARVPRRRRLRRGVGDAAPLPRGAAGLDLGGLGQRHEPRRAARADALAALARGVPRRGRAGAGRRRAPRRARARSCKGQFADPETLETRARRVVEAMALCLQGSLLVRHGAAGGRRRLLRLAPGRRRRPRVRHAAGRRRLRRDHRRAGARSCSAGRRQARGPSAGAYHRGMGPRGNLQLARIFGIRIGVSASWFVVLFLLIYWLSRTTSTNSSAARETTAYLVAVAGALGYFASLILHELGHALVARRLGIPIAGIDLWFFGGLSQMRREPETRRRGVQGRGRRPGGDAAAARAAASRSGAILASGGALHRRGARRASGTTTTPGARADRLARLHQRDAVRLQHHPGVPARRRADRARGDLVAHRRPQPRDAGHGALGQAFALLLGLAGAGDRSRPAVARSACSRCCSPSSSTRRPARRSCRARSAGASRDITVADIMDREPVTIPAA